MLWLLLLISARPTPARQLSSFPRGFRDLSCLPFPPEHPFPPPLEGLAVDLGAAVIVTTPWKEGSLPPSIRKAAPALGGRRAFNLVLPIWHPPVLLNRKGVGCLCRFGRFRSLDLNIVSVALKGRRFLRDRVRRLGLLLPVCIYSSPALLAISCDDPSREASLSIQSPSFLFEPVTVSSWHPDSGSKCCFSSWVVSSASDEGRQPSSSLRRICERGYLPTCIIPPVTKDASQVPPCVESVKEDIFLHIKGVHVPSE